MMSASGDRPKDRRPALLPQAAGGGWRRLWGIRCRAGAIGAGSGTNGAADDAGGRHVFVLSILAFAAFVAAVNLVNVLNVIENQPDIHWIAPVIWEYSSWTGFLAMAWLPWMMFRLASPQRATPPARYLLHLPAALLFSIGHVTIFLALRVAAYAAMGAQYRYARNPADFLFELPKDVLAYALLVTMFAVATRLLVPVPPIGQPAPATFDIRDGARLIRVALTDILAIAAAGNYVEFSLRDGRRVLMRASLAAIEARLADHGFVRTHRSWLVNCAAVSGLEPEGSGDFRVLLGPVEAPLSRRFPEALKTIRG